MPSKDVLKLITFQSFFLINNIGRNILSDNGDIEEMQFFFKMYQYVIFDLIKFLNINIKQKIDCSKDIENLTKREMFVIYNYIIDFINNKKTLYEQISFDLN